METVLIAVNRPNDPIAVLHFITKNRGYEMEPTNENIQKEISRAIPDALAWKIITREEYKKIRAARG